jgi:chromosome segregation protein
VTVAGDLWRWDGLVRRADAPAPAAARLVQLARLREIEIAAAPAAQAAASAERAASAAEQASAAAFARLRDLREAARCALSDLTLARERAARAERLASERQARRDALAQALSQLNEDQAEAARDQVAAQSALAQLPDPESDRQAIGAIERELRRLRGAMVGHQQAVDRLAAEAEQRTQRLAAIAQETQSWQSRLADAQRQIEALERRRTDLAGAIEALAARPGTLAQRIEELTQLTAEADERRRRAADELAAAEQRQADHERRLRHLEAELADVREARGRGEGALVQSTQTRAEVVARIADRLGTAPEQALGLAELRDHDALPDPADAERRLERLLHERETMGPVNLRAEQEADDLARQIGTYESERTDLVGAIDRFRRAIGELNREGRERLLASFAAVNRHFGEIFTRLFGGGRAHLELIEGEDPLDSGLEVMASPPGKKLESLSLLSGGEQALTALSLLFAVFLTNPAPICILDEVDAPLDDANVDRFCTLVDEIARETSTRFLIVTHHRMTMARMHRLYGVTMQERGVSRLVSVDLEQAQALRDAA